MRATLKFNLPEESLEYLMATKADSLVGALREYREWLRDQRKYADLTDEAARHVGLAWDTLHEIIQMWGVGDLLGLQ